MPMTSSFKLKEFKKRSFSTGYADTGRRLPAALDVFDSDEY